MTYQEIMNIFNNNDTFIRENGVQVTELKEGSSTVTLIAQDRHLNANHVVQGGALFTMIDIAGCAAILSYGEKAVTLNASINYLSAASTGEIKAIGTVVKKGRQTGLCNVSVYAGEKLIATGSVTAFITGEKL